MCSKTKSWKTHYVTRGLGAPLLCRILVFLPGLGFLTCGFWNPNLVKGSDTTHQLLPGAASSSSKGAPSDPCLAGWSRAQGANQIAVFPGIFEPFWILWWYACWNSAFGWFNPLGVRAPSGTQVAMAGSCESLVAGARKLADQPQPSTPKRGCEVPCIQILGL